ncbi:hypothetical protein BaRGS_00040045 [Batillaria attramentaria]|uniref:Uncharacterized protein n=1 Tax=Batillaria attramentaria TaxID=370345 RepID=A0ABD0J2C2_9CAEN
MTRLTAESVSHSADTDTTRKRQEHGGAVNTAKVTAQNGSGKPIPSTPHIVKLEGLTPVESSPTQPHNNAGDAMKQTPLTSTHISITPEERMPLKQEEKVVAPMAEMENSEETAMEDIDLGDGEGVRNLRRTLSKKIKAKETMDHIEDRWVEVMHP